MAQVDAFLKLDGVKGEAQDSKHKGEIDVLSWSWSHVNTGSAHFGAGQGAGKVQVGDLHIHKRVDLSTPVLVKCCATGKHIASGLLTVRKAGGKALEYFKVEMKNILISSVQSSSSTGSPELFEDVTLNFGHYKITYTPQDESGAAGAAVDVTYDIPKNEAS